MNLYCFPYLLFPSVFSCGYIILILVSAWRLRFLNCCRTPIMRKASIWLSFPSILILFLSWVRNAYHEVLSYPSAISDTIWMYLSLSLRLPFLSNISSVCRAKHQLQPQNSGVNLPVPVAPLSSLLGPPSLLFFAAHLSISDGSCCSLGMVRGQYWCRT